MIITKRKSLTKMFRKNNLCGEIQRKKAIMNYISGSRANLDQLNMYKKPKSLIHSRKAEG